MSFYWNEAKGMFSLCSAAFHCWFFSLNYVSFFLMLDWLFLICCSVRFLYCSFSLSLSLSRDTLGTLSGDEGTKGDEEEDEQGEEWYRSVDRSKLVDLKTDQLNAFRVRSNRDPLLKCIYDKCTTVNTSIFFLLSLFKAAGFSRRSSLLPD